MFPYIVHNSLPLGPVTIHLFGVLVATGILVGAWLTQKRGVELGLTKENVSSMITTTLIFGFLISHMIDVFAYQTLGPKPFMQIVEEIGWGQVLWKIVNPFGGLSSFGGFVGALIGLFTWCRWRKQKVMPYADSLAYGLAAGWMFGRLGCYTAHDHPGRFTDFFLSVPYPEGRRHDLGLDEALWAAGVSLLFYVLSRKKRPLGLYVSLLVTLYGPVRFFLDFLRVTDTQNADPRYFGLTFAQYCAILTVFVGAGLFLWTRKHSKDAATG
jgi:phosphatidylglycerol:prolipoprotein diacylglycerol transferase